MRHTINTIKILACALPLLGLAHPANAGPYSPGKGGTDEDGFIDAGIPGFVGPAGEGVTADDDNGNYVNPNFAGWATGVDLYDPSDTVGSYGHGTGTISDGFGDPALATGEVTGSNMDIVSLGDRDADEIADGVDPGTLTLTFDKPITNGPGADFAAFENGFVSGYSTGEGSASGTMFAELGFVEVSTNGTDFARFPSTYLNYPDGLPGGDTDGDGNPNPISYLSQDVSNIHNLVGKHTNASGESWGTPFDLEDLSDHALVQNDEVDLNDINYVRIVDIAGDGSTTDSDGNRIYDGWVTWGSGGLDFEALGVINQVPEPGTLVLLLLGLGGLALLQRRNRR